MIEKIRKAMGIVGDKSKNITDSTKLKLDISTHRKKMQDMYIELAKSVCEMYGNSNIDEEVISKYVEEINEIESLIKLKTEQIDEKKSEIKEDLKDMGDSAKTFIKDTADDAKDFFDKQKNNLTEKLEKNKNEETEAETEDVVENEVVEEEKAE